MGGAAPGALFLLPQVVDAVTGLPGPSLFPGHHVRHAITALSFHRLKPGLLLAAGADGVISVYSPPSPYPVASLTGTGGWPAREGPQGD